MKIEHRACTHCGHSNRLEIPENLDDKIEMFLKSAPQATLKSLASLGIGILVAPPVGFVAAGAMLAAAIYNDGTAKCTKCDQRFRIR